MDAPSNLWCTKSGTESNLTYRIPTRDDDALQFRLASREANAIQHLAPLGDLIALSGSAEWRIGSVNADALTPSTISVKPQWWPATTSCSPRRAAGICARWALPERPAGLSLAT